ncbi:uncharacterized protein N0V89_006450 [Didymosphaeria variabile]|uniref:DUF3533 domain-containing protein n=1 Tax=Didymosphaeria variabile TaxID=1932322 RepID=A0A9W8XJ00_9PLEO|nr:uncharacterized protein N0V89_006450 [Didymosphaeria variabile]KAJ4351111.1 hypothetical protein N0V89_006450 [Didymosphaeria variabile]
MRTSTQNPDEGTFALTIDQDGSVERKGTSASGAQPHNVSVSGLMKALIPASIIILVVFWINASQVNGIFLNQGKYVKRAKVALADFDGGDFGEALRFAASSNNQSYGYPTFVNIDTSRVLPEQIRHDVFEGKYWAAIVVQPGASTRFEEAINGTASSYNASDVYTCYSMTSRYYSLYASGIQSSAITVTSTAAGIFSAQFVTQVIASGHYSNTSAAASALAGPAQLVLTSAASQEFEHFDGKPIVNTIGAVFPVLMQFFFIMAWNGICNSMHIYAAYNLRKHIVARLIYSTIWPIFTSLCSAGWTFGFRGQFDSDAKMFFAFWAVTWVYSMINFDALDIMTGFVPMAFTPFVFLTWVIFNMAASLGPPTILNPWYRLNYFFPSLHWYQTFVTIISEGGVSRLHYTLPTLAGWLILLKAISPLATKYRVKKAQRVFRYYNERDALDAPH